MAVILSIETSTSVCSVSLSHNGLCLAEKIDFKGPSHASLLNIFIQEMIDFAKANNLKIDAVAVSCGPGSYTGLRIGVSTAKGLCYGFGVPLIGINTLQIMADTVKKNVPTNALLCPMIDARRMEVYAAFYDVQLNCIQETSADIIDETSYADLLEQQPIYFFGNGADKCKTALTHQNAFFVEDIHPIAKNMITLAEQAFATQRFEDVAYFEPFYLKEFVATTPKNKVL